MRSATKQWIDVAGSDSNFKEQTSVGILAA
jgi:hypothetical protein